VISRRVEEGRKKGKKRRVFARVDTSSSVTLNAPASRLRFISNDLRPGALYKQRVHPSSHIEKKEGGEEDENEEEGIGEEKEAAR